MNFRFILSLLLLFFISINIFAVELKVTNIVKTNNNINIEFNNNLTLCNLVLDNDSLISPYYEKKETKYYFFSFLSRNSKNQIIDKIKSNTQDFSKSNEVIEYKVNKCTIVQHPKKIFAFMSIIFNDTLEVQCNMMKGNYGLWIAWPSIKENNKWNKLFKIKDKKLKKEIETTLIKFYKQKRNEKQSKDK